MARYVALLRGINVGGKNIIKMADLRACFEGLGFDDVTTYIQSGNVVFASSSKRAEISRAIEKGLAKRFGYSSPVVLRSERQLASVVAKKPVGFGEQPKKLRYDVAFLKAPLKAKPALAQVKLKPGVDTGHPGTGVIYFSRLTEKASQSRLSRLASLPIYQSMTIRNWNTTSKLLRMLEGG